MSVQDVRNKIAFVIEEWWPSDHQKTDHVIDDLMQALGLNETRHIVRLNDEDFAVQHPVFERLDGSLLDCSVHQHLMHFPGGLNFLENGTYWFDRALPDSDVWERIT